MYFGDFALANACGLRAWFYRFPLSQQTKSSVKSKAAMPCVYVAKHRSYVASTPSYQFITEDSPHELDMRESSWTENSYKQALGHRVIAWAIVLPKKSDRALVRGRKFLMASRIACSSTTSFTTYVQASQYKFTSIFTPGCKGTPDYQSDCDSFTRLPIRVWQFHCVSSRCGLFGFIWCLTKIWNKARTYYIGIPIFYMQRYLLK